MAKRKSISKKLRFEVFKRDSFTCQYCGRSAPDVVLEIEHVNPVKHGGDNDILNLLTACKECNSGKGPRLLDDHSVLQKQRQQLEELEERRSQLEMMLQWREVLVGNADRELELAVGRFNQSVRFSLTEVGVRSIRKAIRNYGVDEVLTSIDISVDQYYKDDHESTEKVLKYISKICRVRQAEKEKPYLKHLFFLRNYVNHEMRGGGKWDCMKVMEAAHLKGMPIQEIEAILKGHRYWNDAEEELQGFIDNG